MIGKENIEIGQMTPKTGSCRYGRDAFIFIVALLLGLAPTTAIAISTLILHPSGAATGDEMKDYEGGNASTALDTNDGESSYGELDKDIDDEARLELDDHTTEIATIVSVQIKTVLKDDRDESADQMRIGLKTNDVEYWASIINNVSADYTSYSGSLYTTNPNTSVAWTWSEIDSLVASVDNFNGETDYFITELYAEVIHEGAAPAKTWNQTKWREVE